MPKAKLLTSNSIAQKYRTILRGVGKISLYLHLNNKRMKLIELNIGRIVELCKKYRVKRLFVFGSILTDRFNAESDVDFSVDFDRESIEKEKLDWADIFFGLIDELQALLGRKVDLVVDSNVTNSYFRKQLDATKQLIYG